MSLAGFAGEGPAQALAVILDFGFGGARFGLGFRGEIWIRLDDVGSFCGAFVFFSAWMDVLLGTSVHVAAV